MLNCTKKFIAFNLLSDTPKNVGLSEACVEKDRL